MAYCFTNIVTTLPFAYYLKFEFIVTKAGLTNGTKTTTNGGYILDAGKIATEIDSFGLEWKPASMQIRVQNVGNTATPNSAANGEFSTNVFPFGATAVELRVWVSFDAGSTYENVFCGFCDLQTQQQGDFDTVLSVNREMTINANSSLIGLRDVAIDFAGNPPTTFTSAAAIQLWRTDETGTPAWRATLGANEKFCLISDLLLNIVQRVPFTADATYLPTLAVDLTGLQHTFKNKTSTLEYNLTGAGGLNQVCLWYSLTGVTLGDGDLVSSFFQSQGGTGTAMDEKNYEALLKKICNALLIVPVPRLTVAAGAYTFTVYFVHRATAATASIAAGALGTPLSLTKQNIRTVTSATVTTKGLPIKFATNSGKTGRDLNINEIFVTSPYFAGQPDPLIWAYVFAVDGTNKYNRGVISSGQLFGKKTASSVELIHDAKVLASQTYSYAALATAGYYALSIAVNDIIILGTYGSWTGEIASFEASYQVLGVSNVIWDLRVFLRYRIVRVGDGTYDNVIYAIERDLGRNESRLKLAGWTEA